MKKTQDLHNEIVRLQKLKVLDIETGYGTDPKEVTSVTLRITKKLNNFAHLLVDRCYFIPVN